MEPVFVVGGARVFAGAKYRSMVPYELGQEIRGVIA
jgi:hypothetical protein